ncbi:MAG: low molecular weight phosphatase family protein [Bryobacterales bacterium]|nr:low molecular weight phosphatase family protein [Bryobacterales bacterium]
MRFSPLPVRRSDDATDSDTASGSAGRTSYANRARVLFVCYGNACRSQMAEGFARAYHADIMEAESAGVSPLGFVPDETAASMLERDVSLKNHRSKGLDAFDLRSFDLIVNMSGFPFPSALSKVVKIEDWDVEDPYLGNERRYRKVRDEIEKRLIRLAAQLRAEMRVS